MILITGGTGYIGAHTCIELLNSHEDVLLIDNLINSKKETSNKYKLLTPKIKNSIGKNSQVFLSSRQDGNSHPQCGNHTEEY